MNISAFEIAKHSTFITSLDDSFLGIKKPDTGIIDKFIESGIEILKKDGKENNGSQRKTYICNSGEFLITDGTANGGKNIYIQIE